MYLKDYFYCYIHIAATSVLLLKVKILQTVKNKIVTFEDAIQLLHVSSCKRKQLA